MRRNETSSPAELIFVYNADSGLLNVVADAVHKAVRPSTYPCNLCAVTFAATGMRKEWKEFVSSLEHPVRFLHRDELADAYGIEDVSLPAAFIVKDDEIHPWISAEEINAVRSLAELKQLVCDRLQTMVR